MSYAEVALNILNTNSRLSSFHYQPSWSHSTGSVIQHDCHNALNQVLGGDRSFEPLGGGPYTFSSGVCSIGVYLVQPGNAQAPVINETWKNIKDWIQNTLMSIFFLDSRPVGSVINLYSGVQVCMYEPADADPEHKCRTATPYARNRALTLQACLDQHQVENLTVDGLSTSHSDDQLPARATAGNFPSPSHSNGLQQAQAMIQDWLSSSRNSNQQPAQAMAEDLPSSLQSNNQQQGEAMTGDSPSSSRSNDQQQAQAITGGIRDLLHSHQPVFQPLSRLMPRGYWTQEPLLAAQCQRVLLDFIQLPMQRRSVEEWVITAPMIFHDPPCSLGLYATYPNTTGAGTKVWDSWRNIDEYLKIIVNSDVRGNLGAFINLWSGIQIVLYNGAWLDPENRLADARGFSLRSELDALADEKRTNRLRNMTSADHEFTLRLRDFLH